MNTKLVGKIDAVYVFGGLSAKNNRAYLQVSDGIEAKFLSLSKEVDPKDFDRFERGDEITLEVEVDAVAGRTKVLQVL